MSKTNKNDEWKIVHAIYLGRFNNNSCRTFIHKVILNIFFIIRIPIISIVCDFISLFFSIHRNKYKIVKFGDGYACKKRYMIFFYGFNEDKYPNGQTIETLLGNAYYINPKEIFKL